jgi:hypothetical protein
MLKLDTISDLDSLHHNQVQESANLEYKASPAVDNSDPRRSEIAKDVSAIANADGGQIVYGMTEVEHLPAGLDNGVDPARFNGLWFEQVIQQNVKPQIEGLKILQIPMANGNVTVVLTIPAAMSRAPHQAKDGKYYRRRNFRNDVMEDYEIRETMRRSRTPNLSVTLRLNRNESAPLVADPGQPFTNAIALNAFVSNASTEPALYTIITVGLDTELRIVDHADFDSFGEEEHLGHTYNWAKRSIGIPDSFPIFKEAGHVPSSLLIALPANQLEGERLFRIRTSVQTPGHIRYDDWHLRTRNNVLRVYGPNPK